MVKDWLNRLWNGWKKIARVIGRFQTRVLLTIVYLLVIGPTWLIIKLAGADPLKRRRRRELSYWEKYPAKGSEMENAKRQF